MSRHVNAAHTRAATATKRGGDCGTLEVLATEHLLEVDRKITDQEALRHELADATTSCTGGPVSTCRIQEAFSPASALRRMDAQPVRS